MEQSRSSQPAKQLAEINQKIVADGQILPAVILKDGSAVQTGTVATLLYNIGLYNAGERGEVENEIELAIPTLLKIGLFNLFEPEEWLTENNLGRQFVGKKAREYLDRTKR